jgi:hypothetical protein
MNRFEAQNDPSDYASIEIDLPGGGKLKLEKIEKEGHEFFLLRPGPSMTFKQIEELTKTIGLRPLSMEEVGKIQEAELGTVHGTDVSQTGIDEGVLLTYDHENDQQRER